MKDEDLLKQSRDRFKLSSDTYERQRERERNDLAFQDPEQQWTPEAAAARKGQQAAGGLPAIPARPMLSISQVDQPCQLVMNQIRAADLGIEVHPLSEDSSKENAEVIQGIIRRVEQDEQSELAVTWAADRASKAGWGVFRVNTRYVDQRDKPIKRGPDGKPLLSIEDFDQVLTVERILRQEYAHPDPAAQRPDFADAEYWHLETWMPFDDFKREYPDAKTADLSDDDLEKSFASEAPDWTELHNDGKRAIRVVEYFYKNHELSTWCLLKDGRTVQKAKGIKYEGVVAERTFDDVNVLWCKHVANEILEKGDWQSPYIPLIPVIGKEQVPFDKERRWVGIIGPAKDGQRFYNVSASTVVENMLLEPKTPFVGDPRQFEGFEAWWQQANSRAFPFLPAHLLLDGQVLPPPARVPKDTTGMSLAMLGLQEAKTFVQSVTGIFDPALGQIEQKGRDKLSGKAILAYQGQSDATNNHYLQNLRDITYPYFARVLLSKLAIYSRPGRVARLLGEEDKPRNVMLRQKFYTDDQGQPVAYDEKKWDGEPKDDTEYYDITEGVYAVTISAGKSYQSRLQQGQEQLAQLIPGLPPELQLLFLPTYLKFLDTPGAPDMAKIAERFRDRQFPGLSKDENEKRTPEQLEAENDALKAQLQQAQQMLQQAGQELQTDQAKQQATIVKAARDNETKERLKAAELAAQEKREREKNDTAIVLQEMKNTLELMKLQIGGQQAQQQQEGQQRHEFGLARATAGSAAIEQAATMDHESGEAMMAREHESMEAESARDFEGEQAERDRMTQMMEAERSREFEGEQAEADREIAEQQAKKPVV